MVETSQRELKNSDTPKVVSQMGSHVRDAALQCAGCAVLFTRAFDAAARLEIGGSGANKQCCLPTPVRAKLIGARDAARRD